MDDAPRIFCDVVAKPDQQWMMPPGQRTLAAEPVLRDLHSSSGRVLEAAHFHQTLCDEQQAVQGSGVLRTCATLATQAGKFSYLMLTVTGALA